MLRYKTQTRPGLVALYDIRPGNGAVYSFNPGAHMVHINTHRHSHTHPHTQATSISTDTVTHTPTHHQMPVSKQLTVNILNWCVHSSIHRQFTRHVECITSTDTESKHSADLSECCSLLLQISTLELDSSVNRCTRH